MSISFTVYGTPASQGSTRAFIPKGWKRPIVTSTNKKLKPWRQEVAAMAQVAMRDAHLEIIPRRHAIHLNAKFFFSKPKSAKKHSSDRKTTAPDLDKLARSLFDALIGIVYEDDSQVASVVLGKWLDVTPRVEVEAVEL